MLSRDDMQRLSRVFNETADLRTTQDARINEWLKEQLGETHKRPWTDGNHPADCGCVFCN